MRAPIVQPRSARWIAGLALCALTWTAAPGCGGSAPAGDGAPLGDGGVGEGRGDLGDPARRCASGATGGRADDRIDPTVRQRVSGDNGDFVDACDAAGNLVERLCEVNLRCTPGPKPSCEGLQTGKVLDKPFDCGGRCQGGTCPARCPVIDEGMDLRATDGAGGVTLQSRKDRRAYACTLAKDDDATDGFDCRTGPVVGQTALITAARLLGPFCTGGPIGTLALILGKIDGSGTAACSFACALPPGK
jgi:hypothetical protein